MFLHTDSNIEEGAQVEVILTLPSKTSEQITVQVRGTVVRVERSSPPGIAIEFEKLVRTKPLVRRTLSRVWSQRFL
jgi:HSP20 family molecular chaperone IbpA